MTDFIIGAALVLVIGAIVFYLYRLKKRGQTCVGCPYAKQCNGKCGGSDMPPRT